MAAVPAHPGRHGAGLRKNISRTRGENVLFDEIRYFLYITTCSGGRKPPRNSPTSSNWPATGNHRRPLGDRLSGYRRAVGLVGQ
jgi:hypothetical protein